MMFPETMTGFFIYATPYLMYPYYATSERPFGPAPGRAQQWAGASMGRARMRIAAVWGTLAHRAWSPPPPPGPEARRVLPLARGRRARASGSWN